MTWVTKADAIAIARAECDRRDWPWKEPIRVSGVLWYHVMTNTAFAGGNVNIHVRAFDGKVVRAGYARR
jgi:hypothetical protein